MKTPDIRPKYLMINAGGLAVIYLLLTILMLIFSRSFLSGMLRDGVIPETGSLLAFFSIPLVLLVFFVILAARIVRDLLSKKAGSRFQTKLLAYLLILIVLSASPMIIITNSTIGEVLSFWRNIRATAALESAERFAVEMYALTTEKLDTLASRGILSQNDEMPAEVIAVQDFSLDIEAWSTSNFSGDEGFHLSSPPSTQEGIVRRELPRDTNVVRYVIKTGPLTLRVVSWNLGDDFEETLEIIAAEKEHFQIIDSIRFNIKLLLVFYYGLFLLPTFIMSFIIAISFTRNLSSPIAELSEAIQRVAEGDLSTRLLPRKGDEFAQLMRSFNMMVEDLERTQISLLKAQEISVWQNLAQQLAHEIKNPLTPIRLSAERVLRRWRNEPEKVGEILEQCMVAIIQEAEGISTLLTQFRTLSKPSEPSSTRIDFRELVEEITNSYRVSHPKIFFDIENTQKGLLLKIDKIKLFQVLSNLIINSIDAMDAKGTIEIRSDLVKKKESGYCRISIKDSGCGISEETLKKLFHPYFTTKESGTGLGLPIVERIITDHGGAIWFNSALGAGTTVFIDLPVEDDLL